MLVGDICNRHVVVTQGSESLRSAVELMQRCDVGTLVVCERCRGVRRPVGMLTDRDVLFALMRHDARLAELTVEQAMDKEVFAIHQDEDADDAMERLRYRGARRAPVIADDGSLYGMLAADDLIDGLVSSLNSAVSLKQRAHSPLRACG